MFQRQPLSNELLRGREREKVPPPNQVKFRFQPEEEGRPACVGSPSGSGGPGLAVGTLGRKTRLPIAK